MTSLNTNATVDLTAQTHMQMSSEEGNIYGFFLDDVEAPKMKGSLSMSGIHQSVGGDIIGVYADGVEVCC